MFYIVNMDTVVGGCMKDRIDKHGRVSWRPQDMQPGESAVFIVRSTVYEGNNSYGKYFSIKAIHNGKEGMLFIPAYVKSEKYGVSLGDYIKSLNPEINDVLTIRKVEKRSKAGRKFYIYEVKKEP